jgi:hypothetical protein
MEENITKIIGDTIAELFDMLGKGEARWITRPTHNVSLCFSFPWSFC